LQGLRCKEVLGDKVEGCPGLPAIPAIQCDGGPHNVLDGHNTAMETKRIVVMGIYIHTGMCEISCRLIEEVQGYFM
jgi:hypothetical protein